MHQLSVDKMGKRSSSSEWRQWEHPHGAREMGTGCKCTDGQGWGQAVVEDLC